MTEQLLLYIFLVEAIISIIGTVFFIIEIKVLYPVISQKMTLALIGFILSLNGVYISRALGIILEKELLRKLLPTLFGLSAALFLLYWGSTIIQLETKWRNLSFGIVTLGLSGYMLSVRIHFPELGIIGVLAAIGTFIIMVIKFFRYSIVQSSYVLARKRLFLMTLAFVMFAIFDGIGVILMTLEIFDVAAFIFSFELIGRFLLFSSIVGLNSVYKMLNHIIK